MRQDQDQAGMRAEDIKRGTMIDGRRVIGLARGLRNGRRVVTVTLPTANRRKPERRTFLLGTGQRIVGTRTPTTHNMPAGPVRPVREPMLVSKRFGRGTDESGQDFHSRLIGSIVYG